MKAAVTTTVLIIAVAAAWWLFGPESDQAAPGRPYGPPGGRAVAVEVEAVQRETVIDSIEAIGTARANESVVITADVTDTVRRVNFKDGQSVSTGTVLVELTNVEEEAQLAEARANLNDARRQLRRLTDLGEQGIAAESDVDAARALVEGAQARLNSVLARLEDRLIRAPFDGVLGFREVSPGTLVTPGTEITTLDDVSVIKLDFTIPETQLAAVRAEQSVNARSAGIVDREFVGIVQTVGTRVDSVTRAVSVRATIPNEDALLKPGMLMNVSIVTREAEAFVISEAALIEGPNRVSVYVIDGERRARKQDIEVASRRRGKVEVTSGLEEGDFVVTRGIVKLSEGMLVSLPGDSPLG